MAENGMKYFAQSFLISIILFCSTKCRAQNSNSEGGKAYTEDQLHDLITNGMSLAEITNKFGPPDSILDESGQRRLFSYNFRSQPQKKGLYLSGFDIDTKDGKVIRWSPALTQIGSPSTGGAVRRVPDASFAIYIGDDAYAGIINGVNANGSADASMLPSVPAMRFVAETWVGRPGEERQGEQTISLEIKSEDAAKLKQLTAQHIGKRLFIVSSNKVLAVPKITYPVDTRKLRIVTKDTNFFVWPTNQ